MWNSDGGFLSGCLKIVLSRKMDSINQYYNERKDMKYYKKIQEILKSLDYQSILDVGARKSPIFEHLDVSIEKTLLDIQKIPDQSGCQVIQADFYTWNPNKEYDIVLCLQVLEHLENPVDFCKKLFCTAKQMVILSVPYKWKKGVCKYHIQDPVDEEKLFSWTKRNPSESFIIQDGKERLICCYKITKSLENMQG